MAFIACRNPSHSEDTLDLENALNCCSQGYWPPYEQLSGGSHQSTVHRNYPQKMQKALEEELQGNTNVQIEYDVASTSYEFLKRGATIEDFLKPDHLSSVVASPEEETCAGAYKPFVLDGHPIILWICNPMAEMTKCKANPATPPYRVPAFVNFMNDIANLCEINRSADVNIVRKV